MFASNTKRMRLGSRMPEPAAADAVMQLCSLGGNSMKAWKTGRNLKQHQQC